MIPGLPLAFASPWLLAALALLPAIWWLLRFTPPRPVRVAFPPTRILVELDQREETPSTTPWWLVLLRVVIAALVIFALARPVLNPPAVVTTGDGPLLVIVDDGWAAQPVWDRISAMADEVLAQAQRGDRPAVLLASASDTTVDEPAAAAELRERLAGLSPSAHASDRARLAEPLAEAIEAHGISEAVWLSDGVEHETGSAFAERLAESDVALRVVTPEALDLPLALGPAVNEPGGLLITALRASDASAPAGTIVARDTQGRQIASAPFSFEEGGTEAEADFDLPVELRNEVSRLEIAGTEAAGAVQLLDDRWQRRVVGIVSGEDRETAQPLLSPLHYVTRALGPFADLRERPDAGTAESVSALIEQRVSALVLADIGTLSGEAQTALEEWVAEGGVLLRFAGPRLAGAQQDDDVLLPARLRGGERALGGTLSWSEPQPLGEFSQASPFAGIELGDDILVRRQVLAEPSSELPERTWASLADGTPLVTGNRVGQGWVVLFHVTANADWSNLPLSGTFVDMLRRLVDLAGAGDSAAAAAAGEESGLLRPLQALDATGVLSAAPSRARPIEAASFDGTRASREHPPGLYGEPDAFRALNVMTGATSHAALSLPELSVSTYPADDPHAIGPWLLAAALALLIVDGIAVLLLGGRGPRLRARRTATAATAVLLACVIGGVSAAGAQDGLSEEEFALMATTEARLAYVMTGNAEIDRVSRAGLAGLTRQLTRRTSLEPGEPMGVDIARDELAFFPFLYWPIDHDAAPPAPEELSRIETYMRQGGTVLFDTRDAIQQRPGADGAATGPGMQRLRAMMRGLDIPALEPVPSDHVLTKAFYLLDDFPGRYEGGTLWVEATLRERAQEDRPVHRADGVSSILITANDLAGAWAIDERGREMFPTSPGGDWQRELAYRSGINIIMYAMTGNYKADQVHVPALLERLGQ